MHDPAQMPREALEAEVIRLRRDIGDNGRFIEKMVNERCKLEERLAQARQRIAELEQERR